MKTETIDLNAFWMPFTANRDFKQAPRQFGSADGMHYYTPEGRPVLDGTAGLWCVNAGHCRAAIVDAIAHEAATLDYAPTFQLGHPRVFELATRLAGLFPGDINKVFFAGSGSEAVDTSLKIALAYHRANGQPERTRFIGRQRGYHGVGFGGISVGGLDNNRRGFSLLPGVDHLSHTHNLEHAAFTRGQPEWGAHLADELEELIARRGAETIAAVIVEPLAGSTGVLVPPVGYLERLREISARHGVLLIFDEVITGFGRLGAATAAELFDVTPDMIVCAKGLTNGAVPMGAVGVRDLVHDTIVDASRAASNSSTATPIPVIRWPRPPAWRRWTSMPMRACSNAPPVWPRCGRSRCTDWAMFRMSSTSAIWGWWRGSRCRHVPARPARAAPRCSTPVSTRAFWCASPATPSPCRRR